MAIKEHNMPKSERSITPADLLPLDAYEAQRGTLRQENIQRKMFRRIQVGPYCTLCFENYETMLFQVQEMLYIEKGGDDQIQEELDAYNPLIPNGEELVATIYFEIENPEKRLKFLETIGGVEKTFELHIEGCDPILGIPKHEVEHTNEAGKASAVHFVHFPFSKKHREDFKFHKVSLHVTHPNYTHGTQLTIQNIQDLSGDF